MTELRDLMPHQQSALDWANPRDGVALFMEMRLGKSAVAVRWARNKFPLVNLHRPVGLPRVLLVAPITTLSGWEEELIKECVRPEAIQWLIRLDARSRIGAAVQPGKIWYMINFEGVRVWPGIGLLPWDVVIIDESTRIKNPQAKVTKVVHQKLGDIPYRAILTGLPNPESPLDYYSQMAFVNGGSFMGFHNFWSFRDALFTQIGYDWIPKRGMLDRETGIRSVGTRERIKEAVAKSAFVMTRKEAKVGSEIFPEKRTVEMNAAQRAVWKQIKKDFKFRDVETKSSGAQHVWLQRVAGGFSPDRENPEVLSTAKYDEIVRLMASELKGEPLVIWFHFNEELAFVYHNLKKEGYSATALLGATPPDKRYSRIKKFQRGDVQVICVQEALGMYALDLSRADTEIYYSNSWAYEMRAQSRDRIIHPKKTHPLLSIDLITEGTTDEDVWTALSDKSVDARSFNNTLLAQIRKRFNVEAA